MGHPINFLCREPCVGHAHERVGRKKLDRKPPSLTSSSPTLRAESRRKGWPTQLSGILKKEKLKGGPAASATSLNARGSVRG